MGSAKGTKFRSLVLKWLWLSGRVEAGFGARPCQRQARNCASRSVVQLEMFAGRFHHALPFQRFLNATPHLRAGVFHWTQQLCGLRDVAQVAKLLVPMEDPSPKVWR